jgi:glycogen synthase
MPTGMSAEVAQPFSHRTRLPIHAASFDIYREGDVVWAQDYHLMLLPAMLKKQHPKMKV